MDREHDAVGVVEGMTHEEKREAVRRIFNIDFSHPLRMNEEEYRRHVAEVKKGSPRTQMIVNCPHCGDKAKVRTSRPLGPLTVQVYFGCVNVACGHTFRAHVEILATISPSACPNLAIAAQLERSARAPQSKA